MKAFIIAGGLGTRSLNRLLPKSLQKINQKSLIEYQLQELSQIDHISEVHLILGYRSEEIIQETLRLKRIYEYDFNFIFHVEDTPLGTAGGISLFADRQVDSEFIFICLGDILPRGAIRECFYIRKLRNLLDKNIIFTHPNGHVNDSDQIKVDASTFEVKKLISKEIKNKNNINNSPAGFYFLNTSLFKDHKRLNKTDLVQDIVIPALKNREKKFYAYNIIRRSMDVGTPERLSQANFAINRLGYQLDGVIFVDRDNTLIDDLGHTRITDIRLRPGVIDFFKKCNILGIPIVCVSNQPSIAKGLKDFLEVEREFLKLQYRLTQDNVYLDTWRFCPHHPDRGFSNERVEFKKSCSCRKPKSGMLKDIKRNHNISLSSSIIIGDSDRDILIDELLFKRIHVTKKPCNINVMHSCLSEFSQISQSLDGICYAIN